MRSGQLPTYNKVKGSKYKSKKMELDGHIFDSKAEAKYYSYLLVLQARGEVKSFEMQKPYELLPKFRHPKTGKAVRAIKYIPDFVVTYADDSVEVIDIKGFVKNPVFLIKQKLFMYKFEVPLIIVKYDYKKNVFYEV